MQKSLRQPVSHSNGRLPKRSKTRNPLRLPAAGKLCLAAAIAALFPVSASQAATAYWDSDANGANNDLTAATGLGGTGNWNNALLNWWPGTGVTDQAWTSGNTAVFWGTGTPIVSLTDNITVGGLQFNTTGYSIGTGANNLTFNTGTDNIVLNNVAAATITGTVSGTGSVSLFRTRSNTSGGNTAGVLTFNGTSTGGWSGATTIGHGTTLALSGSSQALANTSGITLNGGTLTLTNINNTEGALDRVASVTITSNGGGINYTNNNTGTAYSETLGTVALTAGALNIVSTNAVTSGTQLLTLGGLTHTGTSNFSVVAFGIGGMAATNLGSAKNQINVTGFSQTANDQIIGPWATVGTSASAQTDYAVYNVNAGAGNTLGIQGANIAATGNASWVTAANTYTQNASETLGATRTITALRNTFSTATTATASGINLETFGLLNAATTTWTISGGGLVRQQGTAAANLYVNAGAGAITISSVIADNTGALTLVKTGTSTLTMNSATGNTYTGDTIIQEGDLTTSVAGQTFIKGNLVVGSIGGGAAASFTNTNAATGFASNKNLTVYSNGTFNAGAGAQNIGANIQIIGGTVTGSQLYAQATINMTGGLWNASTFSTNVFNILASADTAVIGSSGFLSGISKSFTVADGSADVDLLFLGTIASGGTVTKAGAGVMVLNGTNSNSITTNLTGGTLRAGKTNAFGVNSPFVLSNTAGVVLDLNNFDNSVGSLSTGGATGGNVTLGTATLMIGGDNSSPSYAGAISGTGNLTKNGVGTQTVSGSNSYTGITTINGGSLVADTGTVATVLSSSSGLTVGGGTFQLKGKSATVRSQILNGLTINPGASVIDVNNNSGTSTTLDLRGTTGLLGITRLASGTVDFKASSGTFGTQSVIKTAQANDASGIIGAWATVNGGASLATVSSNVIMAYTGYSLLNAQGDTVADGTTVNYKISAAGSGGNNVVGSATTNINTLTQDSATASTIDTSAGTLRVGVTGGVFSTPTGAALTIGAAAGSGNLTAGGNSVDVAGELLLSNFSSSALTVNANVTDNGIGAVSVVKSGSGTVVLNGTNTFTGGLVMNAGVVQVGNSNALAGGTVAFASGTSATLRLNGNNATISGLTTSTSTVGTPIVENANANAGVLTVNKTSGSSTFAGVLQQGTGAGSFSLVKTGAGTLVLSGANTYTGSTTVNGGVLQAGIASVANVSGPFGNNSAIIMGNVAGAILDISLTTTRIGSLTGGGTTGGNVVLGASTLVVGEDNTSPGAYAGVISGTGDLVKLGSGTLTLSGVNTYTGSAVSNPSRNTTIRAGTLVVAAAAPSGSAGALGNSTTAVLLGDTTGSANASLLTNGAFTVGRAITVQTGNSGLIRLGGNQTTGTSLYTGNIVLGKDLTLTSAAGGQVDFTTGVISGAFNLTVDGGGTVRLTGTNTFGAAKTLTVQGGTTLIATTGATGGNTNLGDTTNKLAFDNGILKFAAAFDPTGRTITFSSGGASFDTNGTTVSFANSIGNSGAGGLTKLGAGTLNLNSATNAYTGITTVSAGTLALVNTSTTNNLASSSKIIVGDTSANSGASLTVSGLGVGGAGLTLATNQTLGGHGTVTGNVTGVSTSTVAPGNSTGKLTINGNFDLGGGKLGIQLDKTLAHAAQGAQVEGADYDQLVVSTGNTVSISGGTLVLEFGANIVQGDVFYILDNQGSGSAAANGQFYAATINGTIAQIGGVDTSVSNQLTNGSTFNVGSISFTINYDATFSGTSNDISLTTMSVPEPASVGVIGLSAFGLLSRRRRSRRA